MKNTRVYIGFECLSYSGYITCIHKATILVFFVRNILYFYCFSDNDPYEHLNISDKDGLLLDKHDSFYHTTKSLLVLFQISGIMPIMRVPPGKYIVLKQNITIIYHNLSILIQKLNLSIEPRSGGYLLPTCGLTSSGALNAFWCILVSDKLLIR